jgi:large subunit ribosomal protein L10
MIHRQLVDAFAGAEGMLIVSLDRLTVREGEKLRNELAKEGVRLCIVRNRLARLALAERGLEAPAEMLQGTVAIAWGKIEAAVHAAKTVRASEAARTGKIVFRGGLLEGRLLAAAEARSLAELPSRAELQAMLLGVIRAPARALVTVLAANPSGLARVLQGRADQLEKSEVPAD